MTTFCILCQKQIPAKRIVGQRQLGFHSDFTFFLFHNKIVHM